MIERIKASSQQLKISMGSKNYSKKELIKNVEDQNQLGQKIVKSHLKYLHDLASGKIYG